MEEPTEEYSGEALVLRLKCEFLCYMPTAPHDSNCDKSKTGTGFLLTVEGRVYIVTAHHVVSNAIRVTATTQLMKNGEPMQCRVVAMNPYIDVAILECEDEEVKQKTAFRAAGSNRLRSGMKIVVVGFAGGTIRTHSTEGVISGRVDFPHNRWQTDAAVNGGNSGGPCINEEGDCVGVCTSGMDMMQNTNFFVGMDEVMLMIKRLHTRWNGSLEQALDFGFHFPAVVHPVNEHACYGKRGGMMVSRAMDKSGLHRGDVIIECECDGKMIPLNAFGKIRCPQIYEKDTIDFRTVLDLVSEEGEVFKWKLRVRTLKGKDQIVEVACGPPVMPTHESFPDMEPIEYVEYGGLIFQMLTSNLTSDYNGFVSTMLDDPDVRIESRVVITYKLAGSPFGTHDAHDLEAKILSGVLTPDGKEVQVKTLGGFMDLIESKTPPLVLTLRTGECVGTTPEALAEFEAGNKDSKTRKGRHFATRGRLRRHMTADEPDEPDEDPPAPKRRRMFDPCPPQTECPPCDPAPRDPAPQRFLPRSSRIIEIGNELFLLEQIRR